MAKWEETHVLEDVPAAALLGMTMCAHWRSWRETEPPGLRPPLRESLKCACSICKLLVVLRSSQHHPLGSQPSSRGLAPPGEAFPWVHTRPSVEEAVNWAHCWAVRAQR